jgi:hypothetical protein
MYWLDVCIYIDSTYIDNTFIDSTCINTRTDACNGQRPGNIRIKLTQRGDAMIELFVFLFTISLASTVFIYSVAYKRRADCTYWLKIGLLFGPFAIPFVFYSKKHGRLNNY